MTIITKYDYDLVRFVDLPFWNTLVSLGDIVRIMWDVWNKTKLLHRDTSVSQTIFSFIVFFPSSENCPESAPSQNPGAFASFSLLVGEFFRYKAKPGSFI